jgi:hypothetical protein
LGLAFSLATFMGLAMLLKSVFLMRIYRNQKLFLLLSSLLLVLGLGVLKISTYYLFALNSCLSVILLISNYTLMLAMPYTLAERKFFNPFINAARSNLVKRCSNYPEYHPYIAFEMLAKNGKIDYPDDNLYEINFYNLIFKDI